MPPEPTAQIELLRACQQVFDQAGLQTALLPPEGDTPYTALVVRLPGVGEREAVIDLQLNYLPFGPEVAAAGTHVLQLYAELSTAIPREASPELIALINHLNGQLPLGAFALFPGDGILFWKYTRYQGEGDREQELRLLDQQAGLVLHLLQVCTDALLGVASGEITAEEALEAMPVDLLPA
ncbi:MAG: hypothetical protein ABIO70_28230 [Pseudomonadota bacterium]